jgi:hypothetical protein
VKGSEPRVWSLGFKVWSLGFRVQNLGDRGQVIGVRILDSELKVQDLEPND